MIEINNPIQGIRQPAGQAIPVNEDFEVPPANMTEFRNYMSFFAVRAVVGMACRLLVIPTLSA